MKKQYIIRAWKNVSDGHADMEEFEQRFSTKKQKKKVVKMLKKHGDYEIIEVIETLYLLS